MLSQRVARVAASAWQAPTVKAFTTSAATRSDRTPALGDIQPDQHETFNSRQKKFRSQLAEAQKQREASGFASSSPLSSSRSSPSSTAQGLGSLSTASDATGNAARAAEHQPPRKAGPLTNLIYGTKEGRELDAQIEASFSQVLARGKYVHSIEFHDVKPECVDEYVALVGEWYPRVANSAETKVHLVGSWRTEVGDCDTFGEYPGKARSHANLTVPSQSTSGNTSATKASTHP
jgi:hypothetical protein